jgi:hypothetical protein
MRKIYWMAATAGLWLVTSGVRADEKTADQKYCAALASYQKDIAQLDAMGGQATVADVRNATSRIDKDVSDMKKAASKMDTPSAKEFTEAIKQLDKDANSIPDNATMDQVQATMQADVKRAKSAGAKLASEAGCPVSAE